MKNCTKRTKGAIRSLSAEATPQPLTSRTSDVREVYAASPLASLEAVCSEMERVAADMTAEGCSDALGPLGPPGMLRFVERVRDARARLLMGATVAATLGGKARRRFVSSLLPQPLDARPTRERGDAEPTTVIQ